MAVPNRSTGFKIASPEIVAHYPSITGSELHYIFTSLATTLAFEVLGGRDTSNCATINA